MTLNSEDGETFLPILNVPDSCAPMPEEVIEANIRKRLATNLPRLHKMEGYGKYKGPDPLAIIAGGPSLNKTLDELRAIPNVMVCGSAHDHIISLGVTPQYAVICDPDPIAADFVKRPVHGCRYLIASSCDDSVFEALQGYDVVLWNSAGSDFSLFRGEPCIQGGGTVTLRALNIALVLGYMNLHFFGFDSSFEDHDNDHAYKYTGLHEDLMKMRVGGEGGRVFLTNASGMVQALHFQEQLKRTGYMFQPTVHGDGMIAEIVRLSKQGA